LINDHDLTYAKIRFDDGSIATLKAHLGKLNDGLSRALCWSAAWDMFRDAELSATDFIEIALTGLAGEDDITTVTALMSQLNTAVEIYAADRNRDTLREKVAGALLSLLKSAKAGSDHQLQFARSFAALAHSKEQGAEIRNILDGKFQDLKIDADLRWHLILCLVERGLSSRAEIDAELERDNTLTGALSHERCIAAFPTLEAKEAAFKKATEDESITNWSRLSAIQGYNRPIQRHLHEGFVDRYFDLILETYNTKSYEVSTSIIDLLYPSYLISSQTLAKTEAWLNGPGKDSHPTLRRHILEAKDSLERALRVRGIDN
jgi:aminopeptidase N